MSGCFPFNVRVYRLLVEQGRVLVSDERINDMLVTKFPGGGLEFGEGPEECVVREWMEELGQQVEVESHFYTTGFYQPSAFRKEDQVISIYYLVHAIGDMKVSLREKPFELHEGEREAFRWLDLKDAAAAELTFPIDKKVLEQLQANY